MKTISPPRLWNTILFTALLVAAAEGALILTYGSLGEASAMQLPALAGALVLAGAASALLPQKSLRAINLHGTLVVGSVLFLFPFLWLVSTSFKDPREITAYPPQWIPPAPDRTTRSPYSSSRILEPVLRPDALSEERWQEIRPELEDAVLSAALAHVPTALKAGLRTERMHPALTAAAWNSVARSLPDEVWTSDTETIRGELTRRVDPERIHQAWNLLYRCVALGAPLVSDVSQRSFPVAAETTDALELWSVESGDARISRRQITVLPAPFEPAVVSYDMDSGGGGFTIEARLPLPFPSSEFLAVAVPMRQDASWRRLEAELEMDGVRYVSRDPLYLGNDRWQELRFKLHERDSHDERKNGTWPLVREGRAAAGSPEGTVLVRLSVAPQSRFMATASKFTQNYRDAWHVGQYWPHYMFNSLYLVILNVVGQVASCSLVAFAFARLQWPGRNALFAVMLSLMMLPPQVTMIPVFLVFKEIGWYNTLLPLWVPAFFGAPFFIFMLRQFMKGIPPTLDEAARIDGATYFGVYWRITLPLMRPALAAVAIFTFMGTYNDFLGAVIYVSDQRLYPLALGLFDLRNVHGTNFGMLMAASTIMTAPVAALFFCAQRYFIAGVTLTGMKN